MQSLVKKCPADMIILKISDPDRNHNLRRINKVEIEYKDRLYDVLREIKKGSTIIFICLHDSKEERLEAGLKKADNHKVRLALWDHLVKISFHERQENFAHDFFVQLTFPRITIPLTSSFLTSWSPPPEIS